MSSREIVLWLDDRWYSALSRYLGDETVENYLQKTLDKLCAQLSPQEYEHIHGEIQCEREENRAAMEAAKRFTVLHVKENGRDDHIQLEHEMKFLSLAGLLRAYLQDRDHAPCFTQMLYRAEEITPQRFEEQAQRCLEGDRKVTGVYRLDIDAGYSFAAYPLSGWKRYQMKDISTAAYHANRKHGLSEEQRLSIFSGYVHDRGFLAPGQPFPYCVSFSDEISEMEGALNFYIDTDFDVDKVFGSHVCTTENDDWLNVYADYDLTTGQVRDCLSVILHRGDGTDEELTHPLSEQERAVLLEKMEDYCVEQTGQTLEDYRAQLLQEQERQQDAGMGMEMH